MNTLKNIKDQFGEIISREELKNVVGGSICGRLNQFCNVANECCEGLTCIAGLCMEGEPGCPETPCSPEPGVGLGNYCSVPSGRWGYCGYAHGIWGCVANYSC